MNPTYSPDVLGDLLDHLTVPIARLDAAAWILDQWGNRMTNGEAGEEDINDRVGTEVVYAAKDMVESSRDEIKEFVAKVRRNHANGRDGLRNTNQFHD